MASVSSVNPGVADILQTLSSTGATPLSSALFGSAVQSALQKASPSDLVQLSQEATQLQEASGLFSGANATQTSTNSGYSLLQSLFGLGGSSTAASAAATAAKPSNSSREFSFTRGFGAFGNEHYGKHNGRIGEFLGISALNYRIPLTRAARKRNNLS